jgi:predicted molibdopterin-dependent oxidoreductase YjgC
VLVPACSRAVEEGMKVKTDTERVQHSRRLVMEFLASSVDVELTNPDVHRWMTEYQVHPERFGAEMEKSPAGERDQRWAGHHHEPEDPTLAETVGQPVKIDNELYVRDYSRCILCYKCVEACGVDAQNTFAIAVAGRGFDARISTEYAVPLNESACVYCGNCIGVCPTGALMFTSEHEMREEGTWDETQQKVVDTICPYCGVGCELELHVQDNEIVKVTSAWDNSITNGHLCIKGRFGFAFVQSRKGEDPAAKKRKRD